jgi:hypothetical protein
MKLKLKPCKNKFDWHLWFAWHPIVYAGTLIWMEKVWRIKHIGYIGCWYEYKVDA